MKIWKNIQRSRFKPAWNEMLQIIQMYFICEGRHDRIFIYHFKFLTHLDGQVKMNMPYFLLKSLIKMLAKVRKNQKHHFTISFIEV
jgi:hypothetical protein